MSIGLRIKQRRQELGLSVDDLAAKLKKNRATVYRYESEDIEKLPTTVLEPLAKVLNTTPAYLMGWSDSFKDAYYLFGVNMDTLTVNEQKFFSRFLSLNSDERKRTISAFDAFTSLPEKTKLLILYLSSVSDEEKIRIDKLIGGILDVLNEKNG